MNDFSPSGDPKLMRQKEKRWRSVFKTLIPLSKRKTKPYAFHASRAVRSNYVPLSSEPEFLRRPDNKLVNLSLFIMAISIL